MNKQELIKILACPVCKGALRIVEDSNASGFCCPVCKLVYPIEDGIPIMLIERAIPQDQWPKHKGE